MVVTTMNNSSNNNNNNADNESVSTEDSVQNVLEGIDAFVEAREKNRGTDGVEAADNDFAPEEGRDDQVDDQVQGVVLETSRTSPVAEIHGFSPQGSSKVVEEDFKICGGDTISNCFGDTMTLAFAWEGSGSTQGRRFGLTCAHLIEKRDYLDHPQGRNIYSITSKDGRYSMKWIGKVVCYDFDTDSLIFEFRDPVKVKFNKIRVNPRSEIDIQISDVLLETSSSRFAEHPSVSAFGAQTRGAIGTVNSELFSMFKRHSREPQINPRCYGVWSTKENERPGSKLITKGGDCGMMYIDDQGIPIGMHHGASERTRDGVKTYISWVLPLDKIIRSHSVYFGLDLPSHRPSYIQIRNIYEPYRGENLPVIETVTIDDLEEEREDFVEIVLPNSRHLSDFTTLDNVELQNYGSDDDDQD